jgi:hypothetical protein
MERAMQLVRNGRLFLIAASEIRAATAPMGSLVL